MGKLFKKPMIRFSHTYLAKRIHVSYMNKLLSKRKKSAARLQFFNGLTRIKFDIFQIKLMGKVKWLARLQINFYIRYIGAVYKYVNWVAWIEFINPNITLDNHL